VKEIGRLSSVNSFWNQICNHSIIWKELCYHFYSESLEKDEELSWKEQFKKMKVSLIWTSHFLPILLTNKGKTLKLCFMDEFIAFGNLPLLSNHSYFWKVQVHWTEERFERCIGVTTKKRVEGNLQSWCIYSRLTYSHENIQKRSKIIFRSGDILSLSFIQGILLISVNETNVIKFDCIPMNKEDPLYPFVMLYDIGDSATILNYISKGITPKASK